MKNLYLPSKWLSKSIIWHTEEDTVHHTFCMKKHVLPNERYVAQQETTHRNVQVLQYFLDLGMCRNNNCPPQHEKQHICTAKWQVCCAAGNVTEGVGVGLFQFMFSKWGSKVPYSRLLSQPLYCLWHGWTEQTCTKKPRLLFPWSFHVQMNIFYLLIWTHCLVLKFSFLFLAMEFCNEYLPCFMEVFTTVTSGIPPPPTDKPSRVFFKWYLY